MKRPHRWIPLLVCAAAGSTVQAASLPDRDGAQEDIRDNLRQIKELEDSLRRDAAWSLQRNQSQTADTADTQQAGHTDTDSGCLNTQPVTLSGITAVSDVKIRNKLPNCVNEVSLNQLSRDITAAYIAEGYLNPKINFVPQSDGVLDVQVQEIRIRDISGGSGTVNINTLFPNHKDQILNIRDLDQGIEQANRLGSNQVSMDIYPHDDGTASVVLGNEPGKRWSGSVSVDNQGSSKNHRAVARVQAALDSPLGLSDSLYLGASGNIRQDDDYYSRNANLFYSVPYGAWTFSAYAGRSASRSITQFASGTRLAYRTVSDVAGIKAERVLSRGAKHIFSAYGGIDYLNTKATYGGSRLALQSPKLGTVQAGVSYSKILDSGVWITDFNIERGTGLFGAKDNDYSPFTSRYTNFSLQSDLYQNRWWGQWLVRNRHRVSAQYSRQDLYSTKKFSADNTIRGFRNLALDANQGVALSNNLLARRQFQDGIFFEPFIGADAGYLRDGGYRYRGFGAGIGMNLGYNQRWQVSLEAARGFIRDHEGNKEHEDEITASVRVYF